MRYLPTLLLFFVAVKKTFYFKLCAFQKPASVPSAHDIAIHHVTPHAQFYTFLLNTKVKKQFKKKQNSIGHFRKKRESAQCARAIEHFFFKLFWQRTCSYYDNNCSESN